MAQGRARARPSIRGNGWESCDDQGVVDVVDGLAIELTENGLAE